MPLLLLLRGGYAAVTWLLEGGYLQSLLLLPLLTAFLGAQLLHLITVRVRGEG